ncbi:hypothetical protein [Bordetella sp. LUAb4]|uniref:hypothetical protein n=1 Tax=Bordetella sp. LUAb4 TaxID=2843195 RepID=UPI001E2E82E4|nr:hypothetical protein [Bordetella sp. LUAb4]
MEANLVIALLLALSGGVAMLGEWHGHGLRVTHASRLQVFDAAHGGDGYASSIASEPVGAYPSAAAGLSIEQGVLKQTGFSKKTGFSKQVGFSMPGGAATADLRRDWNMANDGLLAAHADADAVRQGAGTGAGLLRRHTALISGAGHAAGDSQTQQRIADNRAGWRGAADRTRRAGQRAALALRRIDAGWGRATPEFDWLSRWADLVPNERLVAHDGARQWRASDR